MDYHVLVQPFSDEIKELGIIIERTFDELGVLLDDDYLRSLPNFGIEKLIFFGERSVNKFAPKVFSGYSLEGSVLKLCAFQVDPKYRRRGFGREAFNQVVEIEKPSLIHLYSDYRATGFWEKLGFVQIEAPSHEWGFSTYMLDLSKHKFL